MSQRLENSVAAIEISRYTKGTSIPRQAHRDIVRKLLARNPIVALLGARQVGKTTLARMRSRSS